jgi:hypothetical protein
MPWALDPESFPFEQLSTEKLNELAAQSNARLGDPKLTVQENAEQLKWDALIQAELEKRREAGQ